MVRTRGQRSLKLVLLAAVLAMLGCGGKAARRARDAEAALRREVARLEAASEVESLRGMLAASTPLQAGLAARALGRIGGARVRAVLLAELGCGQPSPCRPGQRVRAAAALGLAAALEESPPAELEQVSTALLAALSTAALDERAVLLEALGRAGTASSQAVLAGELSAGGRTAEVAALALGRHGRRKLALDAQARLRLEAATSHREAGLRFAATWALAREYLPEPMVASPQVQRALVARLGDGEAEVRAAAASALGRRRQAAGALEALGAASGDRDWRVAVEAVRALATEAKSARALELLAITATARAARSAREPAEAQVLLEVLRALATHGANPAVAPRLAEVLRKLPALAARAPLAAAWAGCLTLAARERANAEPAYDALATCGGTELPPAYTASLVAEAVSARAGSLERRRDALARLWSSSDARIRAAALAPTEAMLMELPEAEAAAQIELVAGAVAAAEPVLAGAALEVAGSLLSSKESWRQAAAPAAALARLQAAIVVRAATERDAELAGALLELLATHRLEGAAAVCQAASAEPAWVIARAARRCLGALSEPVPALSGAAPAPPVDLSLGVPDGGRRWRWLVTTNRGEIEIDLDGSVAPWHVATVVALTRRGFYDGIDFHRVVPDFVVQGGDPTETGSGGPGFSLPAEPATLLDDAEFAVGAVGFADAGKGSGGSQWFVMHSRAPHLEGRYTRLGRVRRGQEIIDRLLVGDRVVAARVQELPPQ